MKYWIKLTRPINLAIIALTMVLTHWTIGVSLETQFTYPLGKFSIAILVMVCLAAAGNIINDYFDLRVDRINKPQKVLIGRQVKRRVAMVSHQVLNGFAVAVGLWIAWDIGNYWLGLVPIYIATTLWFYSIILKKKILLGNVAIAILIALVPLYAGALDYFYYSQISIVDTISENVFTQIFGSILIVIISSSFAAFGFLLTLIREAQKDLEDLKGDTKVGYQTMPIRFGIKKTKNYISFLFLVTIIAWISFVFTLFEQVDHQGTFIGLTSLFVILPLVKSWWITFHAKEKKDFNLAGNYTKIAMILGLASLTYLWLLTK